MPSKSRVAFQWFNLCLGVITLIVLGFNFLFFALYPVDGRQAVIGWVMLAGIAFVLSQVAYFCLTRVRRRGSESPPVTKEH